VEAGFEDVIGGFESGLLGAFFEVVGQAVQGVGNNTGNGVIAQGEDLFDEWLAEFGLEIGSAIFGSLADDVESSESDLGVVTLEEVDDEFDDGFEFSHIVQEFTDLGKTHQSSMLISPVVLSNHLQNQVGEQRKSLLLVEGSDHTIDEAHTEPGVGVLRFSFNIFNIT